MKKLRKQRGWDVQTLYLPEDFMPIWDQFLDIIDVDKALKKETIKNKNKLISLAIRRLIKIYVKKVKEKLEDETNFNKDSESDQSANKEGDSSSVQNGLEVHT